MRQALGERFHLVHVVRDPRGVSNAGGTGKRGVVRFPNLRHLRTVFVWSASNLSCELFGLLHPAQYRRVRYEDITRSHAQALEKLFASLPRSQNATGAKTDNRQPQSVQGLRTRHGPRGRWLEGSDAVRSTSPGLGSDLALAAPLPLVILQVSERLDEREVVAVALPQQLKHLFVETDAARTGALVRRRR